MKTRNGKDLIIETQVYKLGITDNVYSLFTIQVVNGSRLMIDLECVRDMEQLNYRYNIDVTYTTDIIPLLEEANNREIEIYRHAVRMWSKRIDRILNDL